MFRSLRIFCRVSVVSGQISATHVGEKWNCWIGLRKIFILFSFRLDICVLATFVGLLCEILTLSEILNGKLACKKFHSITVLSVETTFVNKKKETEGSKPSQNLGGSEPPPQILACLS